MTASSEEKTQTNLEQEKLTSELIGGLLGLNEEWLSQEIYRLRTKMELLRKVRDIIRSRKNKKRRKRRYREDEEEEDEELEDLLDEM